MHAQVSRDTIPGFHSAFVKSQNLRMIRSRGSCDFSLPLEPAFSSSRFPYSISSHFEYATMNHPAPLSPRKSRAPPLKIKRRATPPDDAQTLLLDRRIILALLCIRILNALTICTFFQPDEYYQSLEPAWKLVYGYGETTWEWKEGIRGFMYPSLFAVVWRIAKLIGLEDPNTLVIG